VIRALVVAAATLALAAPAHAAPWLGILGDPARFERLTGQQPAVHHVIAAWGQRVPLESLAPLPMLGIGSRVLAPADIARGAGDDYLDALNEQIAEWGQPVYVRPLSEMNGHWNPYCAYNQDGSSRGPRYSTAMFRKAFARIHVLLHGGAVDAKLRRLGLPPLGRDLAPNRIPMLKVVWNPQGYGSPDVAGNSAQAYYPGDAYVDVVGDDLYDIRFKAEWAAAERLYDAHPGKPFAFPEWGLWGIDDPAFVGRMAQFVGTHRRVELISYFNSKPGSIFDLETKPRSRAAYRALIVPLGRGA